MGPFFHTNQLVLVFPSVYSNESILIEYVFIFDCHRTLAWIIKRLFSSTYLTTHYLLLMHIIHLSSNEWHIKHFLTFGTAITICFTVITLLLNAIWNNWTCCRYTFIRFLYVFSMILLYDTFNYLKQFKRFCNLNDWSHPMCPPIATSLQPQLGWTLCVSGTFRSVDSIRLFEMLEIIGIRIFCKAKCVGTYSDQIDSKRVNRETRINPWNWWKMAVRASESKILHDKNKSNEWWFRNLKHNWCSEA